MAPVSRLFAVPWLVRFAPRPGDASSSSSASASSSASIDQHPLLVSALWDLGTTGVAEQGSSLVAGFDRLETAREALGLADHHGLTAEIEPVDDSWIRHEAVDVVVTTTAGAVSFPVRAGPAFGHGDHPTTRVCLELMARVLDGDGSMVEQRADPLQLLDLGTGSGVLAIAAHHLGATHITACDVDPAAVESARFNIEANGVEVDLVLGGVDELAGRLASSLSGFDVIVANVLLVVHEQVASAVTSLLAPRGALVVAGFLDQQADRVIHAYRRARPALEVTDRRDIDRWRGCILTDREG